MLRHEQQSIRMALATVMHHSYKVHTENGAPRGQTTATRTGEEGHEHFYTAKTWRKYDAPRRQKPPPPQPELLQLYKEEPGGSRPALLPEVAGPQDRVRRRFVEQIIESFVQVQILDVPDPPVVLSGAGPTLAAARGADPDG